MFWKKKDKPSSYISTFTFEKWSNNNGIGNPKWIIEFVNFWLILIDKQFLCKIWRCKYLSNYWQATPVDLNTCKWYLQLIINYNSVSTLNWARFELLSGRQSVRQIRYLLSFPILNTQVLFKKLSEVRLSQNRLFPFQSGFDRIWKFVWNRCFEPAKCSEQLLPKALPSIRKNKRQDRFF